MTYDVCIDSTKGVRIDSGDAYTDVVCQEDKGFRVRGAENDFGSSRKYLIVTKDETSASGTLVSNHLEANTFAGLKHYRSLSDDNLNVCRVDFGLGIPKANTPSGAIEVRNKDSKVTARLDLYQPRAGEVTLRLTTSDNKTALLFVNNTGLYAQFGSNTAKLLT